MEVLTADKLWTLPKSLQEGQSIAEAARGAAARILADSTLCQWMERAGIPVAKHREVADTCAEILAYLRTPRGKDLAGAGRRFAAALTKLGAELERFESAAGFELRVEDECIRVYGWRHAVKPPASASIDARPRMPLRLYVRGCIDWVLNEFCPRPTWNPLARDPSDPAAASQNSGAAVLRHIFGVLEDHGMAAQHAHRRNAITARIATHVTGKAFKANNVSQANAVPGGDGELVRRQYGKKRVR